MNFLDKILGRVPRGTPDDSGGPPSGPNLRERLATLRPGMPVQRVAEAMGDQWQRPPVHKGGKIDTLENSEGVTVHLDQSDLIGWIDYGWRFIGPDVAGIRIGMPQAEALIVSPDLVLLDESLLSEGSRKARKVFADGSVMLVQFSQGTANKITFFQPDAIFPDSSPPPYPAAEGQPGAPFRDVNLKLVVLSALLDERALDLGSPQELAEHVLGRPVNLEKEGYDLIPEVLDYLARYPLTPDLLAKARTITFDGGNDIYRFPYFFWGGEDDAFDITSLDGIGLCPNVTSLYAISMIGPVDIRSLTPLAGLETLLLGTGCTNIEALRDLPGLRELRLFDDAIYGDAEPAGHPTRALLAELKLRGIRVQINPAS